MVENQIGKNQTLRRDINRSEDKSIDFTKSINCKTFN